MFTLLLACCALLRIFMGFEGDCVKGGIEEEGTDF